MDPLSSCYFCGTALDEPLATYGVGDTEHAPITLCQGCHHKLESVFETAGIEQDHLSAAPIEAEPGPTSTDRTDGDEESTSGGSDDAETSTEEDETEDSEDEDESENSEIVTIVDPSSESDPDDTATADDPLTTESDASDILVDPEADDGPGAETADESTGETASETEVGGQTNDGDGESLAAQTTISALEYNKVMRLLQNREFPVDREEIEAVATNAYDLRQSECAEVIDLAVDRGLIDEREGQLHRPAEE